MPPPEVVKQVNEKLKKRPQKKGGGRKRLFVEFQGVTIRTSGDGKKIVLENLPRHTQEKMVEAIKAALSQLIP